MSSLVYSLRLRLRRIDQEKLWTYALTTILVLVIYIVVRQLTFPEPQFDVEKFAEIDFTKFQPPKPEAKEKENKPKEQAKVDETPTPTTTAPAEMPQIDLTTLEDLTKMVDQTPKDLSVLSRMASAPSLTMPELNVGTVKPILNAPVIQNRPGNIAVLGTPSNVYNPNLEASKAGIGGVPGSGGYATGRNGPVTGRSAVKAKSEKVAVKNYGEADLKKNLRELFQELAKWMRDNPYPFTKALQQGMRYRPGDLTSKVTLDANATTYDLFMLCNEASEDFGLLLVAAGDSTSATLLRDTGFRQQSFYLSRGIAGRDETQEVISLSMLEERPTKQETAGFYSIFLSWWEKNKPTAGGQK